MTQLKQSQLIYFSLYLVTALLTAAPGGAGKDGCAQPESAALLAPASAFLDYRAYRVLGMTEFDKRNAHHHDYISVKVPGFSKVGIRSTLDSAGEPKDIEVLRISASGEDGGESFLDSELSIYGFLTFNVHTKLRSRPGPVAGRDLFDQMMAFHGDRVEGIDADWESGTNVEIFNSEVEKELSKFQNIHRRDPNETELMEIHKTAAKETWTGKQAIRYGFSHVDSVEIDDDNDIVTAVFTKP